MEPRPGGWLALAAHRLIEVGDDVLAILEPDRQAHHIRPGAGLTSWSGDSWLWVVDAGWMISERVSPTLARCEMSFTDDTVLTPAS